jgi:hypothetical protein
MSAAFIFRTVRSWTVSHGCDYYLSSVTPMVALRREIMNLGLDLASAHMNIAKVWFLLRVEVSYKTTETSFSGLQGSSRIH